MMKFVLAVVCTALFMLSCNRANKNVEYVVESSNGCIKKDSVCVIDVVVSDSVFKHLGQILYTSKYIQLVSEPLLAPIEKIQMLNDGIFKQFLSPKKLIASDYSFFISDIFECEGILFFRYFKDKYSMVALYDTSAKKLIYSGKRMEDNSDSCIPLFNSIDGVYKNNFIGILTPEFIEYYKGKDPHKYSEFKTYNAANDNPIIAFYKVKNAHFIEENHFGQ